MAGAAAAAAEAACPAASTLWDSVSRTFLIRCKEDGPLDGREKSKPLEA